jgi:hypothetical protein
MEWGIAESFGLRQSSGAFHQTPQCVRAERDENAKAQKTRMERNTHETPVSSTPNFT